VAEGNLVSNISRCWNESNMPGHSKMDLSA